MRFSFCAEQQSELLVSAYFGALASTHGVTCGVAASEMAITGFHEFASTIPELVCCGKVERRQECDLSPRPLEFAVADTGTNFPRGSYSAASYVNPRRA